MGEDDEKKQQMEDPQDVLQRWLIARVVSSFKCKPEAGRRAARAGGVLRRDQSVPHGRGVPPPDDHRLAGPRRGAHRARASISLPRVSVREAARAPSAAGGRSSTIDRSRIESSNAPNGDKINDETIRFDPRPRRIDRSMYRSVHRSIDRPPASRSPARSPPRPARRHRHRHRRRRPSPTLTPPARRPSTDATNDRRRRRRRNFARRRCVSSSSTETEL